MYVDLEGNTGSEQSSTWISVSSLGYYNDVEVNDKTKQTLYGGTRIPSLNTRTTMELDVSDINTSAYIVVSFAHTNSLKIYSIWLE